MIRRILFALVLCLMVGMLATTAQEDGTIADGLDSPRGLFYGEDGTLYITDSGSGGEIQAAAPPGDATVGGSSKVYAMAPDGTMSVMAFGLPSVLVRGSEPLGAQDIYVTEDAVWLVLGQGTVIEQGNPINPFTYTMVALDPETLRITDFVDFYAYEAENNVDGDVVDSNPVSLDIAEDGTLYVADAGANAVYTYTADAGLQPFVVWENNPVPSSVDIGPNGDIYVSFLTGFPFPEGGATIERYTPAGELVEAYPGMTTLVDVFVADDGTVYASNIADFNMDQGGWLPETGSVVIATVDGPTPVAEGLNFPYGLAMSPEGEMVVGLNTAFTEPGSGSIAMLDMPEAQAEEAAPDEEAAAEEEEAAPEPATTEEADG
jgi:hypothetical protein